MTTKKSAAKKSAAPKAPAKSLFENPPQTATPTPSPIADNTPAFLLALLVAEKLLKPLPGRNRVHELCDPADFQTRMDKLVASNVNLPDESAKTAPKIVIYEIPLLPELSCSPSCLEFMDQPTT